MKQQLTKKLITTVIWTLLFVLLVVPVVWFQVAETLFVGHRIEKSVYALAEPELKSFGLDWDPPVVAARKPSRTIKFKSTEFSVRSNEVIEAADLPQGWTFKLINQDPARDDTWHYLLQTPELKNGEYAHTIRFLDEASNAKPIEFKIKAPGGRQNVPFWEGSTYYMPADSLLALVSKKYRLPEDYEPSDLVSLSTLGINQANNARLRNEAAQQLKKMTSAIAAAGIEYTVTSGYRSYADQVGTYNFWLDYYNGNETSTDAVSARPGHSEHQLGLTIDFTTPENNSVFLLFETTKLSAWLAGNAWKYGFVISYPEGKTDITGYTYEPWHYRYVGKENAKIFRQSKLTLIEWLVLQNAQFTNLNQVN